MATQVDLDIQFLDHVKSGDSFLVVEGQHRVAGPFVCEDGGEYIVEDGASVVTVGE